jgi:hypothetical protein
MCILFGNRAKTANIGLLPRIFIPSCAIKFNGLLKSIVCRQ